MATLEPMKSTKTYLSVGKGGTFRWAVEEGTEGAKVREYETKDGAQAVKHELHTNLIKDTKITGLSFRDTDFGQQLVVNLDNTHVLSMGTGSNFATSFMKVLPSVDVQSPLTLRSYEFEDEKGKTRRGISITQNEEKAANFFRVEGKNVNGMPSPEKEKMDKDDWMIYFTQVKKFLVEYTTENIIPNVTQYTSIDVANADNQIAAEEEKDMGEEVAPEDMDF